MLVISKLVFKIYRLSLGRRKNILLNSSRKTYVAVVSILVTQTTIFFDKTIGF